MCFDDIEGYVGDIVRLKRARSVSSLNKPTVDDNVSIAAGDEKKKQKKRFIFKKRSTAKPKDKDLPKVFSNTSISSEVEIVISDEELVDLFEKIKFSIILLARLQGFVSEPNAPLLVHRLFTMLQEQWKEDLPVYIPLFKCGFRPNADHYHYSLFKKMDHMTAHESESVRSKKTSVASMPAQFATNAEYYQYLLQRRAHFAKVKRDFLAENSQELSLKAGEYVEILDSSRNWNHLRNRKGMEGYAPYTLLDTNVP
ncbi:unnamed protein product [Schistocephalus solidus]|uniref:SH3 domain-containing protein n=1 Tax=Schistocephalus solidus TaxID=70667 RepID=A0A183TGA0_SCHSO|nr:unnamed protein product [Schistocephalus solidus]